MRKIKTFYDWNSYCNNLCTRNGGDIFRATFKVSRDGEKVVAYYCVSLRDGVLGFAFATYNAVSDDRKGFYESLLNLCGLPFYIDLISDTKVNW